MSPRIIAHRGDSTAARENTPEAFASAVEAGADVLEVDIRTLADGTCIVVHDETLLRLWGVPQHVAHTHGRPTAPGDDWAIGGLASLGQGACRIPTLREVLDQVAALNTGRPRPVEVLVDTVCVDDVAVALDVVRAFHEDHAPELVPLSWCGDVAAMQRVRDALPGATICHNHAGPTLDRDVLRRLRPQVVNVEWTLVTRQLVEQVHGLGLDLACWTVNDAGVMAWLVGLGVDAITTDRPRLLRRVLSRPTSPLALAWLEADGLAAEAGMSRIAAEGVCVARDLAVWANGFTASAPLDHVGTKAHAADPVTNVDVAVERHVREVIAERLGPDHLVVGEEMGGAAEPGRPTWYLDPVDGTTNLANGLPWTSMSLALAVDHEPVVAAVAQPATGSVFLAAKGWGATHDGLPLALGRCDALAGRTVLTELDAHAMWPGMPSFLDALAGQHATPRIMGSGTLALTGIAAGWAAAGVVHRFNPIDHLAGVLIAHEAGAEVVDEQGRVTLWPASGGVCVAAPGAAGPVGDLWRQALATAR